MAWRARDKTRRGSWGFRLNGGTAGGPLGFWLPAWKPGARVPGVELSNYNLLRRKSVRAVPRYAAWEEVRGLFTYNLNSKVILIFLAINRSEESGSDRTATGLSHREFKKVCGAGWGGMAARGSGLLEENAADRRRVPFAPAPGLHSVVIQGGCDLLIIQTLRAE